MQFKHIKRPLFMTAFVLVLAPFTFSQNATFSVDEYQWLAGCWEMNVPERKMTITEQWMKPSGGTMIGMGRTVVNGRTVSFEFLRIVAGEAGVDYIAKPSSNKEETAFRRIKNLENEIVFENPEHDFPQRVIYRKQSVDAVTARIEGTRNGKASGMEIPMTRVSCT